MARGQQVSALRPDRQTDYDAYLVNFNYAHNDPMPGANHKWLYFQNGYGASIINWTNCIDAYPLYRERPWELAVFKWEWKDDMPNILELCYDTSITDDVERYDDFEDLTQSLDQIAKL